MLRSAGGLGGCEDKARKAKEADGGDREGAGPEKKKKQAKDLRSFLLTSGSPFPPCPGLGTDDRDGAGWLARLRREGDGDEPAEDSQILIARFCVPGGALQKPPAQGTWAGNKTAYSHL